MRKFGSAVVAAAMLVSSASVAFGGTEDQGALAPGGAAGVKEAQIMGCDPVVFFAVTAVVVAGGLCLVLCSNGNGTSSHSTTSTP